MKSNEKLDKDRFRQSLGGEAEAYQEVARRLGLLPEEGEETPVLDLDSHRKKEASEKRRSVRAASSVVEMRPSRTLLDCGSRQARPCARSERMG